jgi:anti-anti-sigma factor
MESRFKVEYDADILKVHLSGRLDAANAPALSEEISRFKGRQIKDMVFFAEKLEYISSAGIRVIVFAKQKVGENSKVFLIGASEAILDVINMTGLANFMTVQDKY